MSDIRLGLIGCGAIGRAHAQCIAKIDAARFLAFADIAAEAAESLKNDFGGDYATTDAQRIFADDGIDAVYTGGGTDGDSLAKLKEAAVESTRDARSLEGYSIQRFRALADYHFGSGASLALLAGEVRVKGRELQSAERKALAALTPNGTIALSIEGAKRLVPRDSYIVEIGDFLPRGDVLAPGVTGADDQIRPGDEVIVMGEAAFGVGKARMSGWEMVESTRGIAVELRHVEKV